MPRRQWTEEEDARLLALRAKGLPRWQIAMLFETTERAVGDRLRRIDPALRPWNLADDLIVMRRSADGATFPQIAAELARSVDAVRNRWALLMGKTPHMEKGRAPREVEASQTDAGDNWTVFWAQGAPLRPNWTLALLPVLLALMAGLGLGFGVIVSSLTTKYRDLQVLVGFGVQLWMYATPVIYPLSSMSEKYRWIIVANPMTAIVETFRYGFFGTGAFSWTYLVYTAGFTLVLLLVGMAIFNRVERTFMDTV